MRKDLIEAEGIGGSPTNVAMAFAALGENSYINRSSSFGNFRDKNLQISRKIPYRPYPIDSQADS